MTAVVKVNNFASMAIHMSNYRFLMAISSILMLVSKKYYAWRSFDHYSDLKSLDHSGQTNISTGRAICMSNIRFFNKEISNTVLFQRNIKLGSHLTVILTYKVLTTLVKVNDHFNATFI